MNRFNQYARAAGAAAILIGALVLLGWAFDISLLKSVLPGKIAMKPNTATCFVLIGASLLLLVLSPAQHFVSATRRKAAVVCATLAATIGLATLCEYIFGVDLGIDRLFFRDALLAKADSGRMAAATALGFVLLGGALLLLDAIHKAGRLCSELLALATLLIGVVALLGYIYGIESLYGLFAYTPIAVHTAFLLVVVGLGVLFSRPESGLTSVITSGRGGGVMARRVLPVAVLLLVALAWLNLKGGLVPFVASGITILVIWVWLIARSLNLSDAKREQAQEALRLSEESLRLALDAAHLGTFDWDLSHNLLTWSRWHEEMWGFKPGEFGGTYEAFSERVHADDLPGINAEFARCIAARERYSREFRIVWPDGSVHWVAGNGEFEFSAEGQPVRMLGAVMEITERKRDEEQLRLQSAALESAANAILITDKAGNISWVNPAFTQHTGYSSEEVLGKNPRLLKSGEQDRPFYKQMWDTILAGKVWRSTIINRRKDGTLNHEDLTITPIRDATGTITHFVGIKQDITEKTHAQEALLASELRYRRLFESAKDGILILDEANGRILDVNPFLIEMLDYSKDELVGKELWEIGVFKDMAASKSAFVELQERTYLRYEDLPLKTRRGIVKQVEFVSNSYRVNGSRVIQCNIRDITERKRAAEALAESENRLRAILEAEPECVKLLGADATLIDMNPAGLAMIEADSIEQAKGQNVCQLVLPEHRPAFMEVNRRVFAGESAMLEFEISGIKGTRRWLEMHTTPLRNKDYAIIAALGVTRDITGRKLKEAELAATNQRLEQALAELQAKRDEVAGMTQQLWQASKLATMGELAASIAHELNNPLATVSLRAENLLMQLPEDSNQRKPLKIIVQEVDRMATLVNNLLQFSRRSHRQVSTVDPRDEVATSVEFVHYHLRSRNIEVVHDFADGLPTIQADRQQLRQLFLNLLTNASDAMPQGGKLTLRAVSSNLGDTKAVAIEIEDTGEGITEENMKKIWEPFFTTKPEGKGTGLGMGICRRIVEEHGGTIDIQSQAGHGTTIRIVLPATHGA